MSDYCFLLLIIIPWVASEKLEIRMPDITTEVHDTYVLRAQKVDHDEAYIIGYDAVASADKVHHILVYGCTQISSEKEYWIETHEGMGAACKFDSAVYTILWAWALDAPKFSLPEDIGFKVGRRVKVNYIVLQIHYKSVISDPDSSGIDMLLTMEQPDRLAGIYLFADSITIIPPHSLIKADLSCPFKGSSVIEPFAFRTHTHSLGRRVSAWREREENWVLVGSGDPRDPQMFYLIEGEKYLISAGDNLHARCVFDSSDRDQATRMGPTANDEMCNFYMMYSINASLFSYSENQGCFRSKRFTVPQYARYAVTGTRVYEVQRNWTTSVALGQIGGLSHNTQQDKLVVFHRGSNVWTGDWFDGENNVLYPDRTINQDTVFFMDPSTGEVEKSFGTGLFLLPHGVYLDHNDNVYLTDVALHQVYKFTKGSYEKPSLILGDKYRPGSDHTHFCKPTGVVVDYQDNIYVADGYCNSRVLKFDRSGKFIAEYGTPGTELGKAGKMGLVHDLTIDHLHHEIHVADRENGQVHVLDYSRETFTRVFSIPGAVYSVEYVADPPSLLTVNASVQGGGQAKVMGVDPSTGHIQMVSPTSSSLFSLPHTLTHLTSHGIYIGEISPPHRVWRMVAGPAAEPSYGDDKESLTQTIIRTMQETQIPLSIIVVLAVIGVIPVSYLGTVVVMRCRSQEQSNEGIDRTGFQKLLKDYDSSDEEDIVYKKGCPY